jgi:predicted amidohydrolase
MDCSIVLAQTNPRLGGLAVNLADHLERIDEAIRRGAQVILFPELSLTGYFLKDLVGEIGLDLDAPEVARLAERSRRITIGVGLVERTREGRFYNSLVFLEAGAPIGVHRKVHLTSYGLFDEARDFASGESVRPIESRHGRFGPLICEDFWHVPTSYCHFLNEVDAFLVASASPARGVGAGARVPSSQRAWDTLLTACALFYRTWVCFAGRVGWEDGVGFAGGSAVIDPFGETVAQLPGLEPGLLEARIDEATLRRARIETPLRRDEKPWILAAELARHVPLLDRLRADAPELRADEVS